MGDLRPSASLEWQSRLHQFDIEAAEIARQANAAGVPVVAVFLPRAPQAAMISRGEWPKGFDLSKLDNELRSIIVSHGGIYIDILPDFRGIPNPERGYRSVEGHPNPPGHAMLSGLLAKALTSGTVPALQITAQAQ